VVRINPAHYRPAEVDLLIGSAARARADLGWAPKVDLDQLVQLMCSADDRRVRDDRVSF
jgi:GDPmannose 4,6-dehydratase